MKHTHKWVLAGLLMICAMGALATSCYDSKNSAAVGQPDASDSLANSDNAKQKLEVYDAHGSEATARLTVNGEVLFTTSVHIGKNGLGKTQEGDGKTPVGTFGVLSAFGIKPNPGTAMPYINVTASTFACDEACDYYNQIIDTAAVHHNCRGEDMFHIVPSYNYGLSTDFNRACVYPAGSNIFVHCKGRDPHTAGCIALDEDRMLEILKRCDQSLMIIVKE